MWAPLERELHDRGFQTIAYDASGTGHSPPRLVPLRPHGLARQAAHLLDALGLPAGRRPRRLLRRRGGPGARRAEPAPGSASGARLDGLRPRRRSRHTARARTPRHAAALLLASLPAGHRPPDVRTCHRPRRQVDAPAGPRSPFTTSDAVGLRKPALRASPAGPASRGCTASPRRRSSSPAGRTRSCRRSTRASSARASRTRRFTSSPTPATCCSWTTPSSPPSSSPVPAKRRNPHLRTARAHPLQPRALHRPDGPRHAPVRAPRVRTHPSHVCLRLFAAQRRAGHVGRLLRAHRRRRAARLHHGGPQQGARRQPRSEGEPLRPRRAVAVHLPPGVRRRHRGHRSRAGRRRHDGGRRAHDGQPLGPDARPFVEAMAEQEQRVVLRCRPYSTFAQPSRTSNATTKPNGSRPGSREASVGTLRTPPDVGRRPRTAAPVTANPRV